MTAFLVVAVLMSGLALALVLPALVRGARRRSGVSQRTANAIVHAAELDALDQELNEGRMTHEAHRIARDELLRRVLAEAGPEAGAGRASAGRWPGVAIVLGAPVVAAALYLAVGNPGAIVPGDATAAMASSSATVAQLEEHLRYAPRDGRAWVTLARMHMDGNRFDAAAQAYERALAAAAKIAADPQVWCELADALGMQGGTLQGRPRGLIEKALSLKPNHPRALEMAGSAAYEAGQYDQALQYWSALLPQLSPGSAESRELETAIARVRMRVAFGAQRQ